MRPLGVVSASTEPCVAAAEEALRSGGNVIDALVAAAFATAAGDPAITSYAGSGLLIYREARTAQTWVLDGFSNAPGLGGKRLEAAHPSEAPPLEFRAIELDFGAGNSHQTFHVGRGAAAVPGLLTGLETALRRWGTLPLEKLVAPTIRFLSDGVPITAHLESCIRVLRELLELSSLGRDIFLDGNRAPLAVGDIFRNERLAATLRRLADAGFERWMQDEWHDALLDASGEARGGWLTPEDIRGYRAQLQKPLRGTYREAEVLTPPRPSAGGSFVQHTLRLFERAGIGRTEPGSAERISGLTAVFRAISEVRAAEPTILENHRAEEIFETALRRALQGDAGDPRKESRLPGNTTHISVIDADGNAGGVTISHGEGNGHEVATSGVLMNNFLGEDDLFPQGFFKFTPGNRLQTMMTPTILVDPDGAVTVLGTGGSNRIRTALPQVIDLLVPSTHEHARCLETAVQSPRLHVEGGVLYAETFDLPGGSGIIETASRLVQETKMFDERNLYFGGVHIAKRHADGTLEAAADARRGGVWRVVEG